MSISELISELRDSFLQRDFDRVEETLIDRERKLKAEIEDKKREIGQLNDEIHCQKLEKLSVEMELKRLKELQDGGVIARAVAENGNATRVSGAPGTLLAREAALKSAIEEKFGEIEKNDPFRGKLNFKIKVQAVRGEKRGKKFMKVGVHDGKACLVGEQGQKDGPDAFGEETLDVRDATTTTTIEDRMKEIRLLSEKFVEREKYATAEDEKIDVLAEETRLASEPSKKAGPGSSGNWGQNSSREVPKNFTTKVAEPAGVIKRDFTSSADVSKYLDELENASPSSSSSSSSSGELDIFSFITPVKRTKLSQGK